VSAWRKRPLRIALGLANLVVLIALILWARRSIDLDKLLASFTTIPVLPLVLALGLQTLAIVIYGFRMGRLLDAPFRPGFWTVNTGLALNAVLPFRMGDAAKVVLANRMFGLSLARLSAAVAVEKIMDLAVVLLLLGIATLYGVGNVVSPSQAFIYFLVLAVAVTAIAALFFIVARMDLAVLRLQALGHFLRDVAGHIRDYPVAMLTVITAVLWMISISIVHVFFDPAIGPERSFDIFGAITLLVVAALSIAVPGAPAGLGLFEAAIVVVLVNAYKVQAEKALAFALTYHLLIVLPSLIAFAGLLAANAGRLLRDQRS
jgi:uncharacterized membrane protein YbhN (UPF0104 family)